MNDSSANWWSSVGAALAVGQPFASSTEEFDQACEHIVQLLQDASPLLAAGSHATATFLALTSLEEISKVHVGMFRRSPLPVKRSRDPLYRHDEKHRLAAAPSIAMGSRLQAAIGEARMNELIGLARSGGLVHMREAALYVEQKNGALSIPRNAFSISTARELLLLALEAFDDALVGYTSHSLELGNQTDSIFAKWAGA